VVNILWVPKQPWRDIVSVVEKEMGPDDVLWVDELAVPAFEYYAGETLTWSVWRAAQLYDVAETGAGKRTLIVAAVDPYRNLLNYLPESWPAVGEQDWHHVSLRIFAQSQLQTDVDAPEQTSPEAALESRRVQGDAQLRGQPLHHSEAHVVPGAVIAAPRVSEADDQLHRRCGDFPGWRPGSSHRCA